MRRQNCWRLYRIAATVLAGLWLGVAPLQAEERPVVVELFTAQGCSACPPADAFLAQLAARDDVLALSLHVDYWDYIGWEDTFATPAHSARQRGYAAAAGRKMVYTPQIIVNGTEHAVGTRFREVIDLIDTHRADAGSGVSVQLRRKDGLVRLEAQATRPYETPLAVLLARYIPEATVSVARGENAGRVLTYTNVVTELTEIATLTSETRLVLEFDWPRDTPLAVLVQQRDHGPIEAAARLP